MNCAKVSYPAAFPFQALDTPNETSPFQTIAVNAESIFDLDHLIVPPDQRRRTERCTERAIFAWRPVEIIWRIRSWPLQKLRMVIATSRPTTIDTPSCDGRTGS
jgi:hypothetical protein